MKSLTKEAIIHHPIENTIEMYVYGINDKGCRKKEPVRLYKQSPILRMSVHRCPGPEPWFFQEYSIKPAYGKRN